jgi:tetratricopeptide (TPR) repeat protein
VSDEIRTLTQRLAEEPSSLAFLELGEALRRRGQLEAAYKVARGGVNRYPGLADAHDLMARILSDQGDFAGAFDAWADALRFDPMRTGALKGIAFLYFQAGEVAAALDHLQRAAEADPDDPTISQALARVRRGTREAERAAPPRGAEPVPEAPIMPPGPLTQEEVRAAPAPPRAAASTSADSPFADLEEGERGHLLVDANGMCLGGDVLKADGTHAGERVAAQLAGLSREASRATRLLGLGSWHSIAIESPDAHLFLSAPTPETVLVTVREPGVPMARVGLLAERAAGAARGWLERSR